MSVPHVCVWPECNDRYTTSAARIRHRRRSSMHWYCDRHAIDFCAKSLLEPFDSQYITNEPGFVAFDLLLIFHSSYSAMFWLRESCGLRALGFTSGPDAGYALQSRLEWSPPPAPTAHGTIVNVLHKLGGKLLSIIVHECELGERYFVLHCALSIDHEGRRFQIPVKASDAFAIALESTAPVLVSQRVLDKAPRYRPGMDGGLHSPSLSPT